MKTKTSYIINQIFFYLLLLLLLAITVFCQYFAVSWHANFADLGGVALYPLFVLLASVMVNWILVSRIDSGRWSFFLHMLILYALGVLIIRPALSPLCYFEARIISSLDMTRTEKVRWLVKEWMRVDIFFFYGVATSTPLVSLIRLRIDPTKRRGKSNR